MGKDMTKNADPWTLGYRAGLNGKQYADNPLEGTPDATAWAFGCGQGMKDKNAAAFGRIMEALRAE